MDLVWLVCLRPMGCHLLNFFEISGREFCSSAAKLRPKGNIGKLQRRPVFVSAFDAPVRRCARKTSFFAPIYLTLMKVSPPSVASERRRRAFGAAMMAVSAMQCWPSRVV